MSEHHADRAREIFRADFGKEMDMAGEVQLTCSTHRDNVPVLAQPQ